MAGDWIKLHRQSLESEVFADPVLWRLFTWCLLKANFKPGRFQGKDVQRGQFITSNPVGCDSLGMTRSTFFRGLTRLQDLGCIKKDAKSRWTVITVCNYDTYQVFENGNGIETESKRNPDGIEVETIEEGKKDKNVKERKPRKLRFDDVDVSLANKMFAWLLDRNPDRKKPDMDLWANDFRLLRADGKDRTPENINSMIEWVSQHSFWWKNCQSPKTLREKWDRFVDLRKDDGSVPVKQRIATKESVQGWNPYDKPPGY